MPRFWINPPQSNQRGIETLRKISSPFAVRSPQSNQRGIETSEVSDADRPGPTASIEPAWD